MERLAQYLAVSGVERLELNDQTLEGRVLSRLQALFSTGAQMQLYTATVMARGLPHDQIPRHQTVHHLAHTRWRQAHSFCHCNQRSAWMALQKKHRMDLLYG